MGTQNIKHIKHGTPPNTERLSGLSLPMAALSDAAGCRNGLSGRCGVDPTRSGLSSVPRPVARTIRPIKILFHYQIRELSAAAPLVRLPATRKAREMYVSSINGTPYAMVMNAAHFAHEENPIDRWAGTISFEFHNRKLVCTRFSLPHAAFIARACFQTCTRIFADTTQQDANGWFEPSVPARR